MTPKLEGHMASYIRRRKFLATLLGGAAAWPLAARAQQGERMRRIGILMGYAESDPVAQARVAELRRGLQELGWTEGRNVRFDYRWPGVDPPRIRAHAAEIVELAPDVIISSPAQVTLELNRVTNTLPILFVNVPDPVELGLVASIAHPGGNMTGFANFEHALAGKWLDILKEIDALGDADRGLLQSRESGRARPLANDRADGAVTRRAVDGDRRQRGKRDRGCLQFLCPRENRRAHCVAEHLRHYSPLIDCGIGCEIPLPGHLPVPLLRRRRRSSRLWGRCKRSILARGCLRRPHSQGRQACGPAGPRPDQVRTGHQREDCQSTRCHSAGHATRPRRRGD